MPVRAGIVGGRHGPNQVHTYSHHQHCDGREQTIRPKAPLHQDSAHGAAKEPGPESAGQERVLESLIARSHP